MEFEFTEDGIQETLQAFVDVSRGLGETARAFVEDVTEHVAERAQDNAPLWRYRLRPAIQAAPVTASGDGFSGGVLVPEHIHWASIMHEQLQPWGSGPYNLGPISRTLPGTLEGGVGGKFITRVVEVHKLQYEQHLATAVLNLLQTRRAKRTFRFSP